MIVFDSSAWYSFPQNYYHVRNRIMPKLHYLICLISITLMCNGMEPEQPVCSDDTAGQSIEVYKKMIEQLSERLEKAERKSLDLAELFSSELERQQEFRQNLTNQLAILRRDYSVIHQRYIRCKKSLADTLDILQQISISLDASPSVAQATVSPRKKIFTRSRKTQQKQSDDTLVDTRDYRDAL